MRTPARARVILVLILATPGLAAAAHAGEVDDAVVRAAGDPGCSPTFSFFFGDPAFASFYHDHRSRETTYTLEGRPNNFGATTVTVRDAIGRDAYRESRDWLLALGYRVTEQKAGSPAPGGLWTIEFQSDPVVIVETGKLDVTVCWR